MKLTCFWCTILLGYLILTTGACAPPTMSTALQIADQHPGEMVRFRDSGKTYIVMRFSTMGTP